MHGIFMGEVQALEGAGRTCWDFDVQNTARRKGAAFCSAASPACSPRTS